MSNKQEQFQTKIWNEIPESDNPFAAAKCYCHGYDVYGEVLGKASLSEYIFLLFLGKRPSPSQVKIIEGIAIALANPGIRDHSVQAAMNGGAGGSTNAACLIAALAVGAGQLGGAHEIYRAMEYWHICRVNLQAWNNLLLTPPHEERADIWEPMEHPPGFDPYGNKCTTPVMQLLNYLLKHGSGENISWLYRHREDLEDIAKLPMALSGIVAASFVDLGLTPPQGEMLYLLLRLPGAAVHALEQQQYGWRQFPFFANAIDLVRHDSN